MRRARLVALGVAVLVVVVAKAAHAGGYWGGV